MTTEVTKTDQAMATRPTPTHVLQRISEKFGISANKVIGTLQASTFKGFSEVDVLAALILSDQYGLNPFNKEIYLLAKKGGGVIPYIPIDGFVTLLARSGKCKGVKFTFEENPDDPKTPISCTCYMTVDGWDEKLEITEYYAECAWGYTKNGQFILTDPWAKMPRRMLRHKAYMQTARLCCKIGPVYDLDDAQREVQELQAEYEIRDPDQGGVAHVVEGLADGGAGDTNAGDPVVDDAGSGVVDGDPSGDGVSDVDEDAAGKPEQTTSRDLAEERRERESYPNFVPPKRQRAGRRDPEKLDMG